MKSWIISHKSGLANAGVLQVCFRLSCRIQIMLILMENIFCSNKVTAAALCRLEAERENVYWRDYNSNWATTGIRVFYEQ